MNLTVICPRCEHELGLGAANSILILFRQQMYLSFTHITCPRPQCEHEWNSFFDDDPEVARNCVTYALREGWPVETHGSTPAWVTKQYEEQIGYELLQPVELTSRHEELIESLRVMLELTPDNHLMDIFSSMPPKSDLPRSWIE